MVGCLYFQNTTYMIITELTKCFGAYDEISFRVSTMCIPYRTKFRRTKLPKIRLAAENFVRRKVLSTENFVRRNILSAEI